MSFAGRGGSGSRFPTFLLCFAMGILLAGGCQIVGKPSTPQPAPDAEPDPPELGLGGVVYSGSLELEGGEITAALEIAPQGEREVRGALQTTSGLEADGEGVFRGGTLRLTLEYGGECPGRMRLEGPWDPMVGTFSGVVIAQDCTGEAEGTFRFGYTFFPSRLAFLEGAPGRFR